MKIKREFCGQMVEIELTSDELYEAFIEQEHQFDLMSCRDYLSNTYCEEPWYDDLPEETKAMIVNDAAYELRRNIDKYEMSFDYAIVDAFANTFMDHYPEALRKGESE